MNLSVKIIMILFFGWVSSMFLPWWSIALVCFIVVFINGGSLFQNFLAGFLGIFILWILHAFIIDFQNQSILSKQIAELFTLPNTLSLLLVTSLVGGIVGGISSISGSLLRDVLFSKA